MGQSAQTAHFFQRKGLASSLYGAMMVESLGGLTRECEKEIEECSILRMMKIRGLPRVQMTSNGFTT